MVILKPELSLASGTDLVGFEMLKHCRVIGSDSSVALDTLACMSRGVKVNMNLKV